MTTAWDEPHRRRLFGLWREYTLEYFNDHLAGLKRPWWLTLSFERWEYASYVYTLVGLHILVSAARAFWLWLVRYRVRSVVDRAFDAGYRKGVELTDERRMRSYKVGFDDGWSYAHQNLIVMFESEKRK